MRPLFVTAAVLIFAALCGWCSSGCSPEPHDCTSTCVSRGWAQTAEVCKDDPFLREKKCKSQILRSPILGEEVVVYSAGEARKTLVVSILADAFAVGGPQTDTELGSGVVALSDRALLGIVQSVDGDLSICTIVEEE
jgi:hypothetical protein